MTVTLRRPALPSSGSYVITLSFEDALSEVLAREVIRCDPTEPAIWQHPERLWWIDVGPPDLTSPGEEAVRVSIMDMQILCSYVIVKVDLQRPWVTVSNSLKDNLRRRPVSSGPANSFTVFELPPLEV